MKLLHWALIQSDWCPCLEEEAPGGKILEGRSTEAAICESRREASEGTRPANTLIVDFWPPKL